MDKPAPTFKGASQVTIDAKGRLAMPSKYRRTIMNYCSGELVLTADRDECLLIYPEPDWRKIESALISLPSFDKHARFVQRLMLGYAAECEMNSQGRVLLPPPLREFAHINRQTVLIGQGSKFELWDYEHWNRHRNLWLQEGSDTGDVHKVLENIRL